MDKATLNRPKYPQSLKNRMYFGLVQLFFSHFQSFREYFAYFLGFNGILIILKVLGVVVVVLGAFWSFSRISGYFRHSWYILVIFAILGGSFQRFWDIYRFFDILVILKGKIIFFDKNNSLKLTRMTLILPKSPKYPENHKMSIIKTA